MKKLLFSLIILFAVNLTSFAQEKCSKFKDGTFRLRDPESTAVYMIERRGNKQYEELVGQPYKVEFDVKWLSDCIYTLTPTKEAAEFLKDDHTLTVEIVEIKEKSLVLKMYMKDIPNSDMTTEVEIVKSI